MIELRAVAVDGGEPVLDVRRDVDHERGPRARRNEVKVDRPRLVRLPLARGLREVGEVERVRDDLTGLVMVVVAEPAADRQVVVRREDHLRPVATNHARDLHPVLERVLDAAVAEVEALAHVELQLLARLARLLGADLGRAPAHVAGRHVDDPGRAAAVFQLAQHATGADLGVIGMWPEGEDVDRHGGPGMGAGRSREGDTGEAGTIATAGSRANRLSCTESTRSPLILPRLEDVLFRLWVESRPRADARALSRSRGGRARGAARPQAHVPAHVA